MEARPVLIGIAAVTAIALGVNVWVHLNLAVPFDGNRGALLGQGSLFRIESAADVLAAVAIVVLPRLTTAASAAIVAAGGAAVLVLTTFVPLDGTPLGLPLIFEPAWYPDKVLALVAQLVALAGAALVARRLLRRRTPRTA